MNTIVSNSSENYRKSSRYDPVKKQTAEYICILAVQDNEKCKLATRPRQESKELADLTAVYEREKTEYREMKREKRAREIKELEEREQIERNKKESEKTRICLCGANLSDLDIRYGRTMCFDGCAASPKCVKCSKNLCYCSVMDRKKVCFISCEK